MFYLFLFMFLLSSKLPPISGCTKVLPSSPAFPQPEVSLTLRESDSHSDCRPLFLWIKELGQDRMGHQLPHCRKHMEERLLTHKLHWWWCRHRIRAPKSHRAGVSCVQIHPIILQSKAIKCLYLSSPFLYPFINTCFLFLTKYVWQTQQGQVYFRSNLDKI